jgi:hypothetical protein
MRALIQKNIKRVAIKYFHPFGDGCKYTRQDWAANCLRAEKMALLARVEYGFVRDDVFIVGGVSPFALLDEQLAELNEKIAAADGEREDGKS